MLGLTLSLLLQIASAIPAGWRRHEVPYPPPHILLLHDVDDGIPATISVTISDLQPYLRGKPSIDIVRRRARPTLAAMKGKYEIAPRETSAAGLPAAEWVIRYPMTPSSGGVYDMRTHSIGIAHGATWVVLSYCGESSDDDAYAAFAEILRSYKIAVR